MTSKKFWVATGHTGAEDSPVWNAFEYVNGSDYVRCFDSEVAAVDDARRLNRQMFDAFLEAGGSMDGSKEWIDDAPGFSVQEGDPLMLFYGWNFPRFNGASVQAMEAACREVEYSGYPLIAFRAARDPDGGYPDDGSIEALYELNGDGKQLVVRFTADGTDIDFWKIDRYARRIDAIRDGWTASDDWK